MGELARHDPYPSRVAGAGGLLARRDPVVHGAWRPAAPLTPEQTRCYETDGYLVLEGLFTDGEVSRLQQQAGRLLADPSALDPQTLVREPDDAVVRSIFAVHRQDPLFGGLAADDRLAGIARFLLDDRVYVHQSRLNYKAGLRGKDFYWHSDFETWHVEDGMPRMRALSMSVLLSDNRPENGPLMVIPGSHRRYVACAGTTPDDHYKQSLRRQDYGVPNDQVLAELAHAHGIHSLTGPAGTVILFDCNLMHGSSGNITPWPRSNAFIVYNAVSNALGAPYGTRTRRPDFIAARPVPEDDALGVAG